jgi:hypothetical protein
VAVGEELKASARREVGGEFGGLGDPCFSERHDPVDPSDRSRLRALGAFARVGFFDDHFPGARREASGVQLDPARQVRGDTDQRRGEAAVFGPRDVDFGVNRRSRSQESLQNFLAVSPWDPSRAISSRWTILRGIMSWTSTLR